MQTSTDIETYSCRLTVERVDKWFQARIARVCAEGQASLCGEDGEQAIAKLRHCSPNTFRRTLDSSYVRTLSQSTLRDDARSESETILLTILFQDRDHSTGMRGKLRSARTAFGSWLWQCKRRVNFWRGQVG
jgi:hypothetical protein